MFCLSSYGLVEYMRLSVDICCLSIKYDNSLSVLELLQTLRIVLPRQQVALVWSKQCEQRRKIAATIECVVSVDSVNIVSKTRPASTRLGTAATSPATQLRYPAPSHQSSPCQHQIPLANRPDLFLLSPDWQLYSSYLLSRQLPCLQPVPPHDYP